jgi:exopolyphosphatase/guanosine-5'-triphosphate,3'-diphosphate pyrophosphatase
MSEAPRAPGAPQPSGSGRRRPPGEQSCYAALDLGTNNCRLLVATPSPRGFRVVEAYSRIVRLGEGLSQTGQLSDEAMDRSMAALKVCAEKIRRRKVVRVKAVATQACRGATNGPDFVRRVAEETGLRLQIITPKEEAQLSVAGCMSLFDREAEAALVVDVGGGSTELSWVDLKGGGLDSKPRQFAAWKLPIKAWLSIPIGVVTLAERFPEGERVEEGWFRAMVDAVKARIEAFPHAEPMRRPVRKRPRPHGRHLGRHHQPGRAAPGPAALRPQRRRRPVDAAPRMRGGRRSPADLTAKERALEPCIGADRADLVLAGAAILQAVQELWPCSRVRVADRGLREGLLMSLMSDQQKKPRRRRRGGSGRSSRPAR